MKPMNTKQDTERNVIDANSKFRAGRPRLKVLKNPALTPDEGKVIDLYIAARRKQQAAAAAADAIKPTVLRIVQTRQQVARRGALVSLDHSYTYHYSAAVTVLAKTLSEQRETERDNGTAKAVVSATVAFEDVRRKEKERREAQQKAS
jgi:hypothetical protein